MKPIPPRAVFLGDSYTVGRGASNSASRYSAIVARTLGWTEVNAGQSTTGYGIRGQLSDGQTFPERADQAMWLRPDIIIVQGGLNDDGRVDIEPLAAEMFTKFKQQLPTVPIVVLGPTYAPAIDAERITRSRDSIRAAAGSVGVTFLDPYTEGWLEPGDFDVDGVHPNYAGHTKIAERLIPALPPLQPRMPAS